MLVLIDESGDPGFRIARGSSSHFVIVMIVFDDYLSAEKASVAISTAQQRLRVKPEFKFTKSRDSVKTEFFSAVCGFEFKVRALVVDKSVLYSEHLRENSERFYNFFVQSLLKYDNGLLQKAHIKIDGSGDKEFKRELNSYLRKNLAPGQMCKITFKDSKTDCLIQLADMCAGAIHRAYRSDEKQDKRWLEMLKRSHRIDNIWPFR